MQIHECCRKLDRGKVVILISPWNAPARSYFLIEKLIPEDFGYIHYHFSKDILSSDPELTKSKCLAFVERITNDMQGLRAEKPRKFYMYGQSLGGLFAMITADLVDVERVALIVPGDNLAEAFWNGKRTRGMKEEMEHKGMSLDALKKLWKEISPDSYFRNRSLKTHFIIRLSNNDSYIPSVNGLALVSLMKERGINVLVIENSFSHKFNCMLDSIWPKPILNLLLN